MQQALRTVPGNLTKSEEKNLSTLSALVDRAATKGLTPDEAAQLKSGLAALAEKHPKAEKQIGLTKIANSVAVNKPTAGDAKALATPPADGKVAVTTPPAATTAPAETKAAVTVAPVAGGAAGVAKPSAGQSPEGKVAVTTPSTSPVATPAALPGAKVATPAVVQPQLREPERGAMKPDVIKPIVAIRNPTPTPSKSSPGQEMHREAPAVIKPTPAPILSHVEQPPKVITPPVAHATNPVVTTPKAAAPVVNVPKPPQPTIAAAQQAASAARGKAADLHTEHGERKNDGDDLSLGQVGSFWREGVKVCVSNSQEKSGARLCVQTS